MPVQDASAPSIADEPLQTARVRRWDARIGTKLETLFDAERDQLPLWLPVGLGLGIAAWFALPDSRAWIAFLLAASATMLAAAALGGGTRWGRALIVFALAAMLGCALIWTKAERVAAPVVERARRAGRRLSRRDPAKARMSASHISRQAGAPTC